jgi:histone deacetylase 11
MSELKRSLALFQPDFILYNAGTDCMMGDPLGQMNLSKEAIITRDAIVFGMALYNDPPIPITMVLSGGYQQTNAALFSESILNLIRQFDLLQQNKE